MPEALPQPQEIKPKDGKVRPDIRIVEKTAPSKPGLSKKKDLLDVMPEDLERSLQAARSKDLNFDEAREDVIFGVYEGAMKAGPPDYFNATLQIVRMKELNLDEKYPEKYMAMKDGLVNALTAEIERMNSEINRINNEITDETNKKKLLAGVEKLKSQYEQLKNSLYISKNQ